MKVMKRSIAGAAALAAVISVSACSNTLHGVAKDTSKVTDKVAEATNTGDVKTALIADNEVDTSAINVDTIIETKTVVLRGSVPTAAMKQRAEMIAKREARGYTVTNELAVVAQ